MYRWRETSSIIMIACHPNLFVDGRLPLSADQYIFKEAVRVRWKICPRSHPRECKNFVFDVILVYWSISKEHDSRTKPLINIYDLFSSRAAAKDNSII